MKPLSMGGAAVNFVKPGLALTWRERPAMKSQYEIQS
jgi:hypothetical protein